MVCVCFKNIPYILVNAMFSLANSPFQFSTCRHTVTNLALTNIFIFHSLPRPVSKNRLSIMTSALRIVIGYADLKMYSTEDYDILSNILRKSKKKLRTLWFEFFVKDGCNFRYPHCSFYCNTPITWKRSTVIKADSFINKQLSVSFTLANPRSQNKDKIRRQLQWHFRYFEYQHNHLSPLPN